MKRNTLTRQALGRPKLLAHAVGVALAVASAAGAALAQSSVAVPNFWDPYVRVERPEPGPARIVRFLTDDEYPPLHFASPDGGLSGLSVELARAVCERLNWTCTVQARRFDTLADSLAEGRGDVLAAAINLTPPLRARFAASHLYFRSPARFLGLRANARPELEIGDLAGKRIAVATGTAHAAFLERHAPAIQRRPVQDLAAALSAVRAGEADYLFGDGVALSVLLSGNGGQGLAFAGGPYLESRYFGEGVAFLLRKDDAALRRAIDYALQGLWDDGTYGRLFLRFFPVSPF